ncbi:MAG: ribosomal protein L7/L12 [Chloroflexota bacterium]|nr:ribosomal protein L7/L12 [Chloroflexota bacterium]
MLETWSAIGLLFVGVVNLTILLVANFWPDLLIRKSAQRRPADRAPIDRRWLDHERLDDLVRSGNKIQAIKLYRDETGANLVEARDAVEGRAREIGIVPRPRAFGVSLLVFGLLGSLLLIVGSLITLIG